jgi:hypothetical protein
MMMWTDFWKSTYFEYYSMQYNRMQLFCKDIFSAAIAYNKLNWFIICPAIGLLMIVREILYWKNNSVCRQQNFSRNWFGYMYNIGLLTESEVCTGKYLPEVFVQTERRRSEVCADKPKANTFPYRPSKTRLIIIIWLFKHIFWFSYFCLSAIKLFLSYVLFASFLRFNRFGFVNEYCLRKSMFNNRFRTTFSVTATPRKNAYKPSLYDICLEYGIKDVKFIFLIFHHDPRILFLHITTL